MRIAAGNAQITGSSSTNNTASGIVAEVPGVRIGSNRAVGNAQYGINAPGAVDLGGNRARNNGVGQCFGVVCNPRT